MEDMNQQLPKTNAEWLEYYQSILAELTENQKKIDKRTNDFLIKEFI